MVASDYRLRLFAFLGARDASVRGVAQSFAREARCRLASFKRGERGGEVDILVAYDDGGGADGIFYFRIDEDGQEVDQEEQSTELSYADSFDGFLTWGAEREQNREKLPRILIFSAHGTPGYGLTDGLRKAYLRGALDDAIEKAKQLLAPFPGSKPSHITVASAAVVQELKSIFRAVWEFDQRDQLFSLSREDFLRQVSLLIALLEDPREREFGVTLLAVGKNENDRLSAGKNGNDRVSVRSFAQIIEGGLGSFDVILLQACALGLVEIAYELRNVCDAVVLSSVELSASISLEAILCNVLDHGFPTLAETSDSHSFSRKAPKAILTAEMAKRIHATQETAFFASRSDCATWERFNNAFCKFCEQLVRLLECDDSQRTRSVLLDIQSNRSSCATDGRAKCDPRVHDLWDFACRAGGLLGLAAEANELIDAHNAVLLGQFATQFTTECCRSKGMTLYLPASPAMLFDSYDGGTSSNPDGFALLNSVPWRTVLKYMLDGHDEIAEIA